MKTKTIPHPRCEPWGKIGTQATSNDATTASSKSRLPWIVGTGFSRGIGLELAKEIKAQGYSILHIGRKTCGFEDEFLFWDLSSLPSIDFFQSLHSKLQGKNIFGFFYSAGLFPALPYETNNEINKETNNSAQSQKELLELGLKQKSEFWHSQARAIQVNYLSCAALVEEILPHILGCVDKNVSEEHAVHGRVAQNEASKENAYRTPFIAHFSSLAAVDPLPAFEFYGITKAATLKYFEDLSKRFSHVNFFSIHPGTVHTDMTENIMSAKEHQHLPVIKIFQNALAENKLISTKESAKLVADFLFREEYATMRASAQGKLYLADTKKCYG